MFSAKRRLLVVDDEKDITSTFFTILKETGFEVIFFNDPLLALEHFNLVAMIW